MKNDVFQVAFWATSRTSHDGKYHPAVRTLKGTLVWYNIKCATEDQAKSHARKAVDDANAHLRNFTDQWNVQEA